MVPKPQPLRDPSKKGWHWLVDGKPIGCDTIEGYNDRLGVAVFYGRSPASTDAFEYDQPWIAEGINNTDEGRRGGGAVICAYTMDPESRAIYLSIVHQNRPLQNGESPIWNVPRGMKPIGATFEETAQLEFSEETGITAESGEFVRLPGEGVNCNSTYFMTWFPDEDNTNNGIRFFAVAFPWNAFEGSGLAHERLRFKAGVKQQTGPQFVEGILRSEFFRLDFERLSQLGDLFTLAAVTKLLCYLNSTGEIDVLL